MLAQSFKSAKELGIREKERAALIETLRLLETGKLVHVTGYSLEGEVDNGTYTGHFNMEHWNIVADCGTIACLGGTAELLMQGKFARRGGMAGCMANDNLERLFYPDISMPYEDITADQAAFVLRTYLTTGEVAWEKS